MSSSILYLPLPSTPRFVHLKDFLIPLLAKEEWAAKIKVKFCRDDWTMMAKSVSVLQVTTRGRYFSFLVCTKCVSTVVTKTAGLLRCYRAALPL